VGQGSPAEDQRVVAEDVSALQPIGHGAQHVLEKGTEVADG
jgi:hypothetical protein